MIFMLISFLPIGIFVYFGTQGAEEYLTNMEIEHYQEQVSDSFEVVDIIMDNHCGNIKSFAKSPIFQKEYSPEEITSRLVEWQKEYSNFQSLSYFDINRIRIADSEGIAVGKQHLLEGFWQKIYKGEISCGDDVRFGPERKILFIYLAAPVMDERGGIIGAVVGRFEPKQLETVYQASANDKIKFAAIADQDGNLLFRTDNLSREGEASDKLSEIIFLASKDSAETGGVIEEKIEGENYIIIHSHEPGYNDFAGNNWIFAVSILEDDIIAPAVLFKNKMLLRLPILFIFIIVFGFIFSAAISGPIAKLSQAARAIIEGDLTRRVNIKSKDEIGQLADSFNKMVESLLSSEKYARKLIEASLDPLVTINEKGKITDVNEATVKAIGFSRQKLIGTDFSDYFTEPDKARAGYKEVLLKGSVRNYPLVIRHKNGELMPVSYNASVYRDIEGKVKGVFAAARDMSEAKKYSAYRLAAITPILQKISMGDFSQNINIPKEEDEFTEHLVALNLMTDDLRETVGKNAELVKELEKEKISLEQRVKERTVNLATANQQMKDVNQRLSVAQKEIQNKIIELERFNKITMGRELRILELKEEVASLKAIKQENKKSN